METEENYCHIWYTLVSSLIHMFSFSQPICSKAETQVNRLRSNLFKSQGRNEHLVERTLLLMFLLLPIRKFT